MIPTLILAGLVAGRWWFVPIAAAVFPTVVLLGGDVSVSLSAFLLGAVPISAANTAVGVAVHRTVVLLLRRLRGFLQDPVGAVGGD